MSLADYVGRMKEGQDAIYYITAESYPAAASNPAPRGSSASSGVEVLLMCDRIDEWVATAVTEFQGKLQSVTRGGLDLGKLEGEDVKKPAAQDQSLLERIQRVLEARASAVRATQRLVDSPACLVSDDHGISTNLERMLKAAGQDVPTSRPILEVNPQHPIVQHMQQESDEARFADWSHILFDQATLAEGGQLEDPAVRQRLNALMLTLAQRTAAHLGTGS